MHLKEILSDTELWDTVLEVAVSSIMRRINTSSTHFSVNKGQYLNSTGSSVVNHVFGHQSVQVTTMYQLSHEFLTDQNKYNHLFTSVEIMMDGQIINSVFIQSPVLFKYNDKIYITEFQTLSINNCYYNPNNHPRDELQELNIFFKNGNYDPVTEHFRHGKVYLKKPGFWVEADYLVIAEHAQELIYPIDIYSVPARDIEFTDKESEFLFMLEYRNFLQS